VLQEQGHGRGEPVHLAGEFPHVIACLHNGFDDRGHVLFGALCPGLDTAQPGFRSANVVAIAGILPCGVVGTWELTVT
jgi:hypothetical protein